MAAGEGPL